MNWLKTSNDPEARECALIVIGTFVAFAALLVLISILSGKI